MLDGYFALNKMLDGYFCFVRIAKTSLFLAKDLLVDMPVRSSQR